jgi:glutamine synthetase
MSEYNYGVSYQLPAPRPATTIQRLQGNGVRYVRIQWTDLAGMTCFRVIPLTHFAKILDSPRPSVGIAKAALGLVFHGIAEGFSMIGEYLYVPDLTSARVLPYAPGHVSVMGFFEEKIPLPDPLGDITLKVSLCSRTTLQRVIE